MPTANLQAVIDRPWTTSEVTTPRSPQRTRTENRREQRERQRPSFRRPKRTANMQSKGLGYTRQVLLTSLPLAAADVATVLIATFTTGLAISLVVDGFFAQILWTAAVLPTSVLIVNCLFGIYPGVGQNPIAEFRQLSVAITTIFAVLCVTTVGSFAEAYFFLVAWGMSIVLNHVLRSATRRYVCRTKWWRQPAIIFGDGAGAAKLCKSLDAHPELGLRPVGLVEDAYSFAAAAENGDQAGTDGRQQSVFWAIVAMPDRSREEVSQIIETLFRERYPQLLIVPTSSRLPSLWNDAQDCGGMPAVHVVERLLLPVPQFVKRLLDLACTVVGGAILLPLFGLLCFLVRVSSRGPIFYSQKRIGHGGKHFQAWKFRTMVSNADQVLKEHLASNPELQAEWEKDHKLKNDPRVTWIGKILRKTSVDELPQLWNVLRGDMSLVGPRPIVDDEVTKYGEAYRMYKKVIPGITGLWQVSGRNNTTYDVRVHLDTFYVRNWSPWFDLYVLLRTIKVVLLREGAY